MKAIKYLMMPVLLCLLVLAGCSKEKVESKSMEQIRKEEGVPVKIQKIDFSHFEKELTFYAKLEGIKQASKNSIVGGKIEKINARVGSRVEKDQAVIEFDTYNPAVQYEQAKTGFENAEKTYQRQKKLLEAGESSQAAFDGAETQYLVSKRNYESVRQMLFIESPFSGTIVELNVNEGDNVKGDVSLFMVAVLSKMRAKIWASESEVGQMKKGMTAEMTWQNKTYTGKIVEISLAQDPMKQAFYAEVEFDNSSGELRSGVTVEIKVLIYDNPRALIIPRSLVKKDANGIYVFLENNGKAEKRYISNGRESGLDWEISSGIKPGDRIITEGASYLDHGSKVKVIL